MANLNKVFLIGNLTRDPQVRFTSRNMAIAKLGMAINRTYTLESGEKKEETTFVDVDVFGRTAENVEKYLRKGSPLFVEGRLRLDTWEDKQTQQKRSKLGVVAERVQFLDRPRTGAGGGSEFQDTAPGGAGGDEGAAGNAPMPEQPAHGGGDDDNLPF